jgi:hypothetical protein
MRLRWKNRTEFGSLRVSPILHSSFFLLTSSFPAPYQIGKRGWMRLRWKNRTELVSLRLSPILHSSFFLSCALPAWKARLDGYASKTHAT